MSFFSVFYLSNLSIQYQQKCQISTLFEAISDNWNGQISVQFLWSSLYFLLDTFGAFIQTKAQKYVTIML